MPQKLKVYDVDTGEVRVASEPAILQSIALGSCVAVALFDRERGVSGLAHIMLPGRSPSMENNTKYAEDALEALLKQVASLGARLEELEVNMVGGGNVLQEGDIPEKVIDSVLDCLNRLHLKPKGMRVGGIERRSLYLDASTGDVFFSEGDHIKKTLLAKVERT